MKQIIILLISLGFCYTSVLGQNTCIEDVDLENNPTPCCNPLIHTGFPNPSNTEYPALENQFDWLAPTGVLPDPHYLLINYGGNLFNTLHPFLHEDIDYAWFSNFEFPDNNSFPLDTHNMHPKYGWELLHQDMGLGLFGDETQEIGARFNPYMLFYNKYSGKLRMIVSPGEGNSFDEASVDLSIPYDINSDFNYSALLNRYQEKQLALDQKTQVKGVVAHLPFTTPGSWTVTDFQLAYDPCVCNHESLMEFKFTERNFAEVEMTGRIVGREVPLNTSGNSPLAFGEDFLSSVWNIEYDDNWKAQTGMLVYNQINSDVESAYVNDMMKLFSSLLNIAGDNIPEINIDIPSGILDIANYAGEIVDDTTVNVGSGLSSLASFGSKQINTSAPNITYLEAEAALKGFINDESNAGGFADIELLQPGSYHPYRSTVPWTQHPFYNEAPGLFALIETPTMYWGVKAFGGDTDFPSNTGGLGMFIKDELKYTLNPAAEIDMENTEIYAAIEFNAFSRYDEPGYIETNQFWGDSRMGVSYDGNPAYPIYGDMSGFPNFSNYNNITFEDTLSVDSAHSYSRLLSPSFSLGTVEKVLYDDLVQRYPVIEEIDYLGGSFYPGYEDSEYNTRAVFQTEMIPIDKMSDYRFVEYFKNMAINSSNLTSVNFEELFDFRLKIIAKYQFLPNEYGEVNETMQIYTYKMDVEKLDFDEFISCSSDDIPTNPLVCDKTLFSSVVSIPSVLNIGNTDFTEYQDIYAENVVISGDISTSNGVVVNIYASNSIEQINGSSVSPEINLEIYDRLAHNGLNPIPSTELKTFCNSNRYKANAANKQENYSFENTKEEESKSIQYALYPNPTSSELTFDIDLDFDADVSVRIYDISGKLIKELVPRQSWQQGYNQQKFDVAGLSSGLYIFEFCIDENCYNEKVSIAR